MTKSWTIGLLLALATAQGAGQVAAPDSLVQPDSTGPARTSLSVTANVDSVRVVVDGVEHGLAPVTLDTLLPGLHHVRGIPPHVEQWLAESITDSIVLSRGETRTLQLRFGTWYSLMSIPSGAAVYAGDSLVGMTPLVVPAERVPQGDSVLVLRKAGYEEMRVQPGRGPRSGLVVALQPQWRADGGEGNAAQWQDDTSPLRLYLAGGTAILAGAAAAYFKIQADSKSNELRRTGNSALQSEVDRLDTASAVSLVVSQAGILLFSYFLLSE